MSDNEDTTSKWAKFRDQRIDRGIVVALGVVISLVLSVVAWQFKSLETRVETLVTRVEGVAVKLAVIEAGGLESRMRTLEERVTRVEAAREAAARQVGGGR